MYNDCLKEKWLMWLLRLSERITFFQKIHFYIKETTGRQIKDIQIGVLADVFSKMDLLRLFLQGKQLMVFVANNKIRAFQWESEFWKTCVYHCELDSFPIILKEFSNDIPMVILTNCAKYWIVKMSTFRKCISHSEPIFFKLSTSNIRQPRASKRHVQSTGEMDGF